jgi:hypothetical protein
MSAGEAVVAIAVIEKSDISNRMFVIDGTLYYNEYGSEFVTRADIVTFVISQTETTLSCAEDVECMLQLIMPNHQGVFPFNSMAFVIDNGNVQVIEPYFNFPPPDSIVNISALVLSGPTTPEPLYGSPSLSPSANGMDV